MCCPVGIMPDWRPPSSSAADGSPSFDVGLQMMNSLTRSKVPFRTLDGSNNVKWYMCGPTVYDVSHLGHARTYLGFDIIRRIMSSYFGYDVTLVMNITDIDDKIILRANERDISFTDLSRENEAGFLEDMSLLGVDPPDVLTRVSEYVPEIVDYIGDIVKKGFAYASNGSVYFDVGAFRRAEDHVYCKLCPEAIGNAELLAEGEGALTQEFGSEKRAPNDFALWKRSKEGEPSWESPWGPGRPGWHIECSVMASQVFRQMGVKGGCMDIHSGGIDLKFPHHDNEMAQAEAQSGEKQWVNYFVHSGHLSIKERKMSKSLKNFITIRQALQNNTARQIRMLFLLHKYNAPMDYSDDTMAHATVLEKSFSNFFQNVKVALRSSTIQMSQKWTEHEQDLHNDIDTARYAVRKALLDDFDTATAMTALQDLVKAVNKYLETQGPAKAIVSLVVRKAAVYVTEMFRVFGLISAGTDIGFPLEEGEGAGAVSREDVLAPVLDAVLEFRAGARDAARTGDAKGVLAKCDAFRDAVLPELGVRLEDKTEGSVWKLADPEELRREAEQAKAEMERKREAKEKAKQEQARKDALNKLPPEEYMKQLTLDDGSGNKKYGTFGDDGLPLTVHSGEALNKNQVKKASKEFSAHKKRYEKYLKTL